MGNLKETFIKKYGIAEYIVLMAGVAILGRGVYSLIILNLKDTSWEEIAMIVFIFCIGLIACLAPLSLLDFARKRLGMETKRESNNIKANRVGGELGKKDDEEGGTP